ncbi:MAG: hypothetical protein WA732_17690, partial [Pseudolabrys sp.]
NQRERRKNGFFHDSEPRPIFLILAHRPVSVSGRRFPAKAFRRALYTRIAASPELPAGWLDASLSSSS